MYHAVIKEQGKLLTVATWTGNANSCLRLAEVVFRHHGIKAQDVRWASVAQQKNWHGYIDGCLHLTDSETEAEAIWRSAHPKEATDD